MKKHSPLLWITLALIGCSPTDQDSTNNGSGGSATSGSGGAASSGGQGSGAMSSGGQANGSGGDAIGSGSTSSGGSTSGGSSSGGGDSSSGGMDGSGGAEAGKLPVVKSAGCGKANPMTGSASGPLSVSNHQYYVKLPTGYDPDTAYPLIMVFHPTGNPIDWGDTNEKIYEENEAKDKAIRVFPKSAGSGWEAGDVSFFAPFHEKMLADFCVDESRVFASGESSGGDYVSILGCEHADKLTAVAPCATKAVGQYPLNLGQRTCTGQLTPIVIHGQNDNVVQPTNGPLTRDFYKEINHCGDAEEPVAGYTDTLSNCVKFTDCDADYPVYWCWHQDPHYNGTNHGWPKMAGDMTWEVFSSF